MLTNEWALKKSVYFSVIHYQSCARMCRCASLTFACLFNCAERARLFAQPILLQISAPKGTFSGSFMIFLCTFLKQKVALGAGGLFIRIFPLTRIPPREREREREREAHATRNSLSLARAKQVPKVDSGVFLQRQANAVSRATSHKNNWL